MCKAMYRFLLVCVLAIGTLFVFGTISPVVHADPAPCADLVITDVQIPGYVIQGQSTQIKITVKNQGTCESLSFTVQWKQDEVAQTGPSFNVDNLAPGGSAVVGGPDGFSYTFPTAGNFNTVATVDSDRTVDETNEANNIEIKPVTVYPDLPDLALAGFSITPENPVQGIPAQIEITVENRGSKDAGPFVVQWKYGQLAPTGPSKQILGLAAGASVNFAFQYAFPNAGDFTTIVNIDTDRTVTESNEDNNLGILATTVLQAAPDLVITDFQITPVDPAPGFPLLPVEGLNARIDLTVLNQGNAPAGPFVVQWKSAQLAPTGPSKQMSGLAAGAEYRGELRVCIPQCRPVHHPGDGRYRPGCTGIE